MSFSQLETELCCDHTASRDDVDVYYSANHKLWYIYKVCTRTLKINSGFISLSLSRNNAAAMTTCTPDTDQAALTMPTKDLTILSFEM